MARIIKHIQTGPKEIEGADGEPIYICMCGLSKKPPFCDGHHKLTRDEEPGKLYRYDQDGKRQELADSFGDLATY
ncbi:MAG: CDGSH iron-sulfur domain-containing protein [Verrucomicrobiae bacterium]|nr:CDGSH iron-sulfur domain-containing protein [Verrucomicrobiae bacterium]